MRLIDIFEFENSNNNIYRDKKITFFRQKIEKLNRTNARKRIAIVKLIKILSMKMCFDIERRF